jgi:hypothetical protein
VTTVRSIRLYQRITEVLETLVNRVDVEMDLRLKPFDRRVQELEDSLEGLSPGLSQLHVKLAGLQEMLSGQVEETAEASCRLNGCGLKTN